MILALLLAFAACSPRNDPEPRSSPNVLLIALDDVAERDMDLLPTPSFDALAAQGMRFRRAYAAPWCSPARRMLHTGEYWTAGSGDACTGVWTPEACPPTLLSLPKVAKLAGYHTGLFGKWHLGDTYPMRPMDQGFEEVLMHLGGGIGQASDPPGGEGRYTDPVLFHNGERVQAQGYCTDVFFDSALDWIEARQADADARTNAGTDAEPFFAYIATNAPHVPLDDVPLDLLADYRQMDLGNDRFPQAQGHPLPEDANTDRRARIYSMITNIDDNIGRLFERLDQLGLTDNTLVLFMVDNGPDGPRYVAGMRGWKGTVYEGGVRSPLFAHWPGHLAAGASSDWPAAHIDVLPTILDALDLDPPEGVRLDGRSFLPALTGAAFDAPDRFLVLQAHRGNTPVRYHNFMIRDARWKLEQASGFQQWSFAGEPAFELYDLNADPLEMTDLAAAHPDEVARLRAAYDAWFDDVGRTRPDNYAPPRIAVGTPHEDPTLLTRQDWHPDDEAASWTPAGNGYWDLDVAAADSYDVHVRFPEALEANGTASLRIGDAVYDADVAVGQLDHTFRAVPLPAGPVRFRAVLETQGAPRSGWQVEVGRQGL
jgi:arylsulfatase/arylsulfatase A